MSRSYIVYTQGKKYLFAQTYDQRVARPDDKGKIGIDQTKEIIRWIQLKPYQNKTKILIINPADSLTIPAQNALLKTLEEPPVNTYIFLIALKKRSLLTTIRSRCQIIPLERAREGPFQDLLLNDTVKPVADDQSLLKEMDYLNQTLNNDRLAKSFSEFKRISENLSRAEVRYIMTVMIRQIYCTLHDNQDWEKLHLVNYLEATKQQIDRNVNIRLALENLYLKLHRL